MYMIIGATGNIGRGIARTLLQNGKKVRAVARDASRMQELADLGAEIFAGSITDRDFLHRALDGADAAFTMIPPNVAAVDLQKYSDQIGEAQSQALRQSRISHVVNLSSLGAEIPDHTGPIAGLHRQEERLNQLETINVLHLRPTFFMENFLPNIPMIKGMGINGSAIGADIVMPMIATADVAAVAAERLLKLDFSGRTIQPLLGERDLSMKEATAAFGRAIGKPDLPYVQFSYEDATQGLMQAGISADVARNYVQMMRAFNEGLIRPLTRTAENTTPTSIEEFAKNVFAQAYG